MSNKTECVTEATRSTRTAIQFVERKFPHFPLEERHYREFMGRILRNQLLILETLRDTKGDALGSR